MLTAGLAALLAVAIASWTWYRRLSNPAGLAAAGYRAIALTALFLLLLDPGVRTAVGTTRPIVLLDRSVSMISHTGPGAAADSLARSLGDVIPFGEVSPGEPGSGTTLLDALNGATATGRPVHVVSDGEVADAARLPSDLLQQLAVHLVPRRAAVDFAITEATVPGHLVEGDTLTIEVAAMRTAGAPDTAAVVVRDSGAVLLRGTLRFGQSMHGRVRLAGLMPKNTHGDRWLEIARVGEPDGEPDDDVRWRRITVDRLPGVVVIASRPDWDARALYRTMRDVAGVPVRGFVQLQPGRWRAVETLRDVTPADVLAAARGAQLVAVRGDSAPWTGVGRNHLWWPGATEAGDWYVAGTIAAPVSGAFAGLNPDSLPAVAALLPLDTMHGGWIGATARLARRGVPQPIFRGTMSGERRTVTIGVDGLYRWPLHGGVADQVWRTLIANTTAWLLGSRETDSALAVPIDAVTMRGRPVQFRWTGSGAARAVVLHVAGVQGQVDTLRFGAVGTASIALPVGRYRYTIDGGGAGSFAVEPYSDELPPAPVTLKASSATLSPQAPRQSLRNFLWLFAVAIAGFGSEWLLRRRMGLR